MRSVKNTVMTSRGEFLFFQEIKAENVDVQVIRSLCAFPNANCVFCLSEGLSGGILLLWKIDEYIGTFSVSYSKICQKKC